MPAVTAPASVAVVNAAPTRARAPLAPTPMLAAASRQAPGASMRSTRGSAAVMKASAMDTMQTWNPLNNKFFETFSYLPPLTEKQVKGQISYLLTNNYIPCIEFSDKSMSYATTPSALDCNRSSGCYENSYWPMWKLPLFGTDNPDEVVAEIEKCKKAFGDTCYIRLVGFDNKRQVQCVSFLVHRPKGCTEHATLENQRRA